MSLGRCERAVIYGSDSIYVQMERWLLNKPDSSADIKEMREFFFDLSAGAFLSAISVLKSRGIIRTEDDRVYIAADSITRNRGERSDSVWRAIRILKVFTAKEIQKLIPDIKRRTVLDILESLVRVGAIERMGFTEKRESIFKLISDSKTRPVAVSQKKVGKADVIWEIIIGFGDSVWNTKDIKADKRFQDCGASSRYLDELLRQWRGEGVVEEVCAEARGRREVRQYRTISKGERQVVLTHYGRKI